MDNLAPDLRLFEKAKFSFNLSETELQIYEYLFGQGPKLAVDIEAKTKLLRADVNRVMGALTVRGLIQEEYINNIKYYRCSYSEQMVNGFKNDKVGPAHECETSAIGRNWEESYNILRSEISQRDLQIRETE